MRLRIVEHKKKDGQARNIRVEKLGGNKHDSYGILHN